VLLAFWDVFAEMPLINAGRRHIIAAANHSKVFQDVLRAPILLTPGSRLLATAVDDAGGAASCLFKWRLWVAPRNTLPPGA
jgi:hypothetical protein